MWPIPILIPRPLLPQCLRNATLGMEQWLHVYLFFCHITQRSGLFSAWWWVATFTFTINLLLSCVQSKNPITSFLFTNISRYTDPVTKMKYSAKVAFKLWIDPDSYKISSQTVQVTSSQIDDHFSNSELEWSTKCRKAIFLCGLMVKLQCSE